MAAYYNEIDQKAAEWLRELIRRSLIAPGDVDERSIADVRADDVRGYTQCHFFAGIGVWSYALRLAGWDDDRPVWTGSCPCQPFSAAGKGDGYADERHLWPHWYRLIRECRPATVFGEQVDAAVRTGWLDDVCLSLESLGYAVGAVDFPAASIGAPHIRQRVYFVGSLGYAANTRRPRAREHDGRLPLLAARSVESGDARAVAESVRERGQQVAGSAPGDEAPDGRTRRIERESDGDHVACGNGENGVADSDESRWRERSERDGDALQSRIAASRGGDADGRGVMGDAECEGLPEQRRERRTPRSRARAEQRQAAERAGAPVGGFWRDAIWLPCRDGKARAVKPGALPLVDGAAERMGRSGDCGAPDVDNTAEARVMRLRGYGNAIVAEQARAFIEAHMEATQ